METEIAEKMVQRGGSSNIVLRVVIIDADAGNLLSIHKALEKESVELFGATDETEGLQLVRLKRPHIVLLDMLTPQLGGMHILERILEMDPGIDVILMADRYSTESAVEAIRKGACDYLTKPIPIVKLQARIRELLSNAQLRQHSQQLESELIDAFQFEGMVGRSPLMLELFRRIHRVAPHFRTVLLIGETGTGKELAARALHRLGPRASGPFVACNCSAWTESLLETELFGAVKGAYTGAIRDREGIFEYASGGTLLLDEIGDVPLPTQTRLLRVLQNQEIQRVGSPVTHKVDVRVIAATSRNLRVMVAENKFREDLYYRLSMMEIWLPPLVDRREDLPLLERHIIRAFSAQSQKPIRGLTRRAQAVLGRYTWPGNVRELENVLGHSCIMAEGDIIDVRDLPEHLTRRHDPVNPGEGREGIVPLEEMQRRYTQQVVDRIHNKAHAADLLGISRTTLYRILAREHAGKRNGNGSKGS